MSEVTIEAGRIERRPRTASERITQFISKTPIHIGLGLIGFIWLVPTIGLLVTSFRPRGDIQASGWWTVFAGNINFTINNYQQVITAQGMDGAFMNSVQIAVPSTLIPLTVAALAAFAFSWVISRSAVARRYPTNANTALTNSTTYKPSLSRRPI
jgi:ABC-type glycerol-3-phosphate transport system permease component